MDASAVTSFKGFIFPLSTLVFCQEDTFRGRGYGVMGCGESQMCTFRETPTPTLTKLWRKRKMFFREAEDIFCQSRFLKTENKKITLFSESSSQNSNYSLTKLITKPQLITSSSHVLLIHLREEYRKTTLRNYHSTHWGMLAP